MDNPDHVIGFETLDGDTREAVEEGFRQSLSAAASSNGVLTTEDAEVGVRLDLEVALGDGEGPAVVEQRVETLKNGLVREVELVQHDPLAGLDGLKENTVAPLEALLPRCFGDGGQVGAEEVAEIGLLGEVDADDGVAERGAEGFDDGRLADAGRTFQEDRLGDHHGAEKF